MKYLFIVLLLISSSAALFSQRFEFKKGKTFSVKQMHNEFGFKTPSKSLIIESLVYPSVIFFSKEKKLTYLGTKLNKKEFKFLVFSDYLNFKNSKNLKTENFQGSIILYRFLTIKNKIFVLFGELFEKTDEFNVYVAEVSEDMIILGSPILLQRFAELNKYGSKILITTSDNKDKVLIARIYDTKDKEKHKFDCKVIDNNFSSIWFKTLETDLIDKELLLKDIQIDNKGNLFIVSESRSRNETKPYLHTYNFTNDNFKRLEIGIKNGDSFGSKLILLKGEKPFLVALNRNKKSYNYFVTKIDIDSQIADIIGENSLPSNFSSTANFRNFDYENWSVSNIVNLKNGNMVASIEGFLNGQSYNAFVVCFSEKGETIWTHEVQKKQTAFMGNGHLLRAAGDNTIIIYNDDLNNFKMNPKNNNVKIYRGLNCAPVIQIIDTYGNVTKSKLEPSGKSKNESLLFGSLTDIDENFIYGTISIKTATSFKFRAFTLKVDE